MGSDNIQLKRTKSRSIRKQETEILKPNKWLIVCEGKSTEPNYFKGAISEINNNLDPKHQLKVDIKGQGKNTMSLVKTAIELQTIVDKYNNTIIPYGKIFVVFDKDDFEDDQFNNAIAMCKSNGFIPLWSNQSIEFWFLLYFDFICSAMHRELCVTKLNENFYKNKLNKYKKNDSEIYFKLTRYGSLKNAKKNARKIHLEHKNHSPSKSVSCTTVYKFYDEVDERLEELK